MIDIKRIRVIDSHTEGEPTRLVIAAGATGWIAGLVNAFPAESVALFDSCTANTTHIRSSHTIE